jgi:ubiquinone/menaquinone biosynthesis C-methylase UbiE
MEAAIGAGSMADPVSRITTRVAYGLTQVPRFAWYVAHGAIMRELAKNAPKKAPEDGNERGFVQPRRAPADRPVPDRWRLYADMAALFGRDLANVEAGIYPLPSDHDGSLPILLDRSRLFFADLPRVHQRRQAGRSREVSEELRGRRPDYYLQNFHFQSGGWMTEASARRYDTQVEVLFKGTANAIRRQALPPLHELFAGRDQRRLRLLDVGCGTGRFLHFVKQAWPRLPVLGLDMSEAYLAEAGRHLKSWCWIDLVVGKGEALPVTDESQDAVTSIFLFHELPPDIRRAVLGELARVLKPGGRLVLVDSLQVGDEPRYDAMLRLFPQSYHEPYYDSYLDEDFTAMAQACGLTPARGVNAFIAKVMVFDKD